jgi:putative oxidoreductase
MSANLNASSAYSHSHNAAYQPTMLLVSRILLSLVFVVIGWGHLTNFGGAVAYFTKWEFPMPQGAAVLAILFELGGGILLIIGWKARWAALALALYTFVALAVAHRYWTYDAAQMFNQYSHFYKNLAIVGGMLAIAAVGPGRYSVDKH